MNLHNKATHTDILPDLDNLAPVTTNGHLERWTSKAKTRTLEL